MLRHPSSVCVLGGGTAGYLSALYFKKQFPEWQVDVVESSHVPVVGVGEATTPLFVDFLHQTLGIPVQEFFERAKPTLKLGIRFDWGLPGDAYFNEPFDLLEIHNALSHTGNINDCSLVSLLMDRHKAPFVRGRDKITSVNIPRGFAYHIDNQNFLAFMHEKVIERGCAIVDARVADVRLTEDGLVDALVTTDGRELAYDFYIDCSGFASLLCGSALGAKWVDYSDSLLTDRAVIGQRPNDCEIAPYTTAATLKHGWLWNTPMQHEDHLGYVFCSDHCSDDEAMDELRAHCQTVNNERVIRFRPGRREKAWIGNVVAVGNSFGFIEPLESTGIHLALRHLRKLGIAMREDLTPQAIDKYNQSITNLWDHTKEYVAMHFKFNGKLDTPFWRSCHNEIALDGLRDYLAYFNEHGALSDNVEHPLYAAINMDTCFPPFSYDAALAGCGINRDYFATSKVRVDAGWPVRLRLNQAIADRAMGHREALGLLASGECQLTLGTISYI